VVVARTALFVESVTRMVAAAEGKARNAINLASFVSREAANERVPQMVTA
jgi:hypothetical protein